MSNLLFDDVKVIDTTPFLIEKAKIEFLNDNFLL